MKLWKEMMVVAVLAAGGSVAMGCGGDDEPNGYATDADSDTDTGEACNPADNTCAYYCQCMADTCPTATFTVDCATDCATLETGTACVSQGGNNLACRIYHCEAAESTGDTVQHCPHAAGEAICI